MRVSAHRSFVMADIPGLIEGAAEGAGLGIRFLKHVSRTLLLLHLVDIVPPDESDPVQNVIAIANELKKFSPELYEKERWLVLNKIDLLPPEEADALCEDIIQRLGWQGKVFKISGLSHEGTERLAQEAMTYLESWERRKLILLPSTKNKY